MKQLIYAILIALTFIACDNDVTSPDNNMNTNDTTYSFTGFMDLSTGNSWQYKVRDFPNCNYYEYSEGISDWEIIEYNETDGYRIRKIESGFKYFTDEEYNPYGDTTYWGPDSSYLLIEATDDTITFRQYGGNNNKWIMTRFPAVYETDRDSLVLASPYYSYPSAESDYDVYNEEGYEFKLVFYKGTGIKLFDSYIGVNCRTHVRYDLIE